MRDKYPYNIVSVTYLHETKTLPWTFIIHKDILAIGKKYHVRESFEFGYEVTGQMTLFILNLRIKIAK